MNRRQLIKIGVPHRQDCLLAAIAGIQSLTKAGLHRGADVPTLIRKVLASPTVHYNDPHFGALAQSLLETAELPKEPVTYRTWGDEHIEAASHAQMRLACQLPMATGAALMPDAHVGYGLPIGGVLALDNAVCPYAVGVDIACRMKLSVLDIPAWSLTDRLKRDWFINALEKGTRFGVGCEHSRRQTHAVLDQAWHVSRVTRENKDKAWRQLGTSGSGNHFVEFGQLTLERDEPRLQLKAGEYVALLSHSGSRGTGAAVCAAYSAIARKNLPAKYDYVGQLAWLGLDTDAGQEYWNAMNLMGDYAAANHDVIHRLISQGLGVDIISGVENHHNFAWREEHGGREVIVHRKGATPAAEGVLGVIPGSMASPAYVVSGRGNADSLRSASHGAGRRMSRTQARMKYNFRAVQKDLERRGIQVLSAGSDEVPGVYKDIDEVMACQTDLVDVVARFDPKIVKMCGDGSRAED